MNARENLVRAIERRGPERVPISGRDTIGVAFNNRDDDLLAAMAEGRDHWRDEWGVPYRRPVKAASSVENKGQPADAPLAEYDNIDDYPHWPDAGGPAVYGPRYREIEQATERAEREGKYLLVSWFTLFERAWMLEGMDRFFMDLPLNPERAHRILDRVNRFRLEFLDRIAPLAGKVHGLYTGDDWGTQRACYISLDHFRAFFKARYRQVIDKAHALGMHVWMHSCGHINEVLQEFIDIGLDVINPQQPLALGIDDISRRYRGRISFEVPADIQKMLPVGMATRAEIEAHVIELIEKWGTPEGGVIGMDYGDYQSIGTTQERAKWAMNVFQDYRY